MATTAAITAVTPNMQSESYYEILGCSSEASEMQLEKAFRFKTRHYHPDDNTTSVDDNLDTDANAVVFIKLCRAYATLSDMNARDAYNTNGLTGVAKYEEAASRQHAPSNEGAAAPAHFYRPTTLGNAKEYYNTCFGNFQQQQCYNSGSLIKIPYSEDLQESFETTRLVQRCTCRTRRFCILLFGPWLVKKEWSLALTLAEVILTWIAIGTWIGSLVDPDATGTNYVGGIAVFFATLLVHYWYGFVRYTIAVPKSLKEYTTAVAVHDSFQVLRNTSSVLLYGANQQQYSQQTALLVMWPVSAVNYLSYLLAWLLCRATCAMTAGHDYYCKAGGRNKDGSRRRYTISMSTAAVRNAASNLTGVCVAMALFGLRVGAGRGGSTVATLLFLGNQHLYNTLLFQKSDRDFLMGLVFGSLFVVSPPVGMDKGESPQMKNMNNSNLSVVMGNKDTPDGIDRMEECSESQLHTTVEDLELGDNDSTTVQTVQTERTEKTERTQRMGNLSAMREDDDSASTISASTMSFGTPRSDAFPLPTEASIEILAIGIAPTDEDICFGLKSHPGTKDLVRAVRACMKVNGHDTYSLVIYGAITKNLVGRRYLIQDSTWRVASRKETRRRIGKIFGKEQKKWKAKNPEKNSAPSDESAQEESITEENMTETEYSITETEEDDNEAIITIANVTEEVDVDSGLIITTADTLPTNEDVIFGDRDCPGTMAMMSAVRSSVKQFGSSPYSITVYGTITKQLVGRRYFVLEVTLREASRRERNKQLRKIFLKEQKRWNAKHLSPFTPIELAIPEENEIEAE